MFGFDKDGKDKSALKVFKEMRIAGYETNICTFNALRRMVAVETKISRIISFATPYITVKAKQNFIRQLKNKAISHIQAY